MVSRRGFLAAITGALLGIPGRPRAQPAGKSIRIGFLAAIGAQSAQALVQSFREGLREHGWVEDRNLSIEYSYDSAGGASLDERARLLMKRDLSLIVADSTPSALALKRANVSLPVVFAAMSEPVETGVVESLARPGRNFTGFTTQNRELMPKRIEVIKELVPAVRRLLYLGDPEYASHGHSLSEVTEVAGRLGLRVEPLELRKVADFDAIAARGEDARGTVFVVEQSLFFVKHTDRTVALELQTKVPAMYAHRQFVERGGTISYGVNIAALYRRAGGTVDRILKGARPANLPVERPTTFDLMINLKTARTLGLNVPQALLARVDRVIE
jgi:putative tryptophan/tyrosine transport system substrate-binding protein